MKSKRPLKPPKVHGDFLLNLLSAWAKLRSAPMKCEQQCTFLTQPALCVSRSSCRSRLLPFQEASAGVRSHRSLQKDPNYLLPSPRPYVVNNPVVFKGVCRNVCKIAARNSAAVSSWSQQPRLSLVQGPCWKCQGGAELGGAGKWTSQRAASWTFFRFFSGWVFFWVQRHVNNRATKWT